jgi:hypothetical protein
LFHRRSPSREHRSHCPRRVSGVGF